MHKVICLTCGALFTPCEGMRCCPACNAPVQVREGIVDLMPGRDFYWGEVSREAMDAILSCVRDKGWVEGLKAATQVRPDLLSLVLDTSRLGWLFHCLDERREACLDLGSGWGSLAFYLCGLFRTVYSLDAVRQRLQFQVLRARQDGVSNIEFLRAPLGKIPLPESALDLVVMNGVLEWAGLSDPGLTPTTLQLGLLREARRVLRPTGRLCIGIENRFGLMYLLGARDHSGVRFTSLLPRAVADLVVRSWPPERGDAGEARHHFEAEGYRTYTYTCWGYDRLVRRAGFDTVEMYWAWPSYTYPRLSGPLDGRGARFVVRDFRSRISNAGLRRALGLVEVLPEAILTFALRLLAPHFIIVAGRQPGLPLMQSAILEEALTPGTTFVRSSLGSSPQLRATYLITDGRRVQRAIKVRLEQGRDSSRVSLRTTVEAGVAGRPMRPHSLQDMRRVLEWLSLHQAATRRGTWTQGELEQEAEHLLGLLTSLAAIDDATPLAQRLSSLYLDSLGMTSLPIVAEHGDFVPANILISPHGQVVPVDWEHRRLQGNPLMDIGAMVVAYVRMGMRHGELSESLWRMRPARLFLLESWRRVGAAVFFSPAYFLLRVIERTGQLSPSAQAATYYYSNYWAALVEPATRASLDVWERAGGHRG